MPHSTHAPISESESSHMLPTLVFIYEWQVTIVYTPARIFSTSARFMNCSSASTRVVFVNNGRQSFIARHQKAPSTHPHPLAHAHPPRRQRTVKVIYSVLYCHVFRNERDQSIDDTESRLAPCTHMQRKTPTDSTRSPHRTPSHRRRPPWPSPSRVVVRPLRRRLHTALGHRRIPT